MNLTWCVINKAKDSTINMIILQKCQLIHHEYGGRLVELANDLHCQHMISGWLDRIFYSCSIQFFNLKPHSFRVVSPLSSCLLHNIQYILHNKVNTRNPTSYLTHILWHGYLSVSILTSHQEHQLSHWCHSCCVDVCCAVKYLTNCPG